MDVTLHVPVRLYVYKYIMHVFGEKGAPFNYWRLNTSSKEGMTLYSMLERMPDRYEKYRPDDIELDIRIPGKIRQRKGPNLSQASVDMFNDYIKQLIMDEILQFHTGINTRIGLKAIDKVTISHYVGNKVARVQRLQTTEAKNFFWQKSIITDILMKYDITEDEISSESVAKYLQRYSTFRYSA
jgi:hypothetical protein